MIVLSNNNDWQSFRDLHRQGRVHGVIQALYRLLRERLEVVDASFLSLHLLTRFLKIKIKRRLALQRLMEPSNNGNLSFAQQRFLPGDYRKSIYLRFRLFPLATPNQATRAIFPPFRCRRIHLWVIYRHPMIC